jgi:DNA primase
MFPISDNLGRVVGFSGRSLADNPDTAKYLNSPEGELFHKGRLLFGLYQAKEAIRNHSRIVLVEGNIDLLSSHQAGVAEVVAPLGTALTPEQVAVIKKFTQNVYLAYDQDKAGRKAAWHNLPLLQAQQLEVKIVQLPYGKDPDECIQHNPGSWPKTVDGALEVFSYVLARINQEYDLSTANGKKLATQEVAPCIAATTDEVSRAFLIHQAADVLGIDEELLKKQVANPPQQPSLTEPEEERGEERPQSVPSSHQDVLATYLISSLLTAPVEQLPRSGLTGLFKELRLEALPATYQPIYQVMATLFQAGQTPFQLNQIAERLPPDSQAEFDRLSLTDTDTIPAVNSQDNLIDRLLQTTFQLNSLYLKHRLTELTEQIKRASTLGSSERDQIKKEFTQVSEEISQYNKKIHS